MYLFKTSGKTIDGVVLHQKHAFHERPEDWEVSEIALISKNKAALRQGEKQISHYAKIINVRLLEPGESSKYWPGTEGRWRYLVELNEMKRIDEPFDLSDVIGRSSGAYSSVRTFAKIKDRDEVRIIKYLNE